MLTKKQFFVGRVNGTGPKFEFDTMAEAQQKISELFVIDPEGVLAGKYYLDAPEIGWNAKDVAIPSSTLERF